MSKLEPGQPAPDFELADGDGRTWRLADLKGQRVILYFYPIDDTPGCTAQACDLRDSHDELEAAGYLVLGVSPQGAESHRAFTAKHDLNFPLLIDDDFAVARAYGVIEDRGEYKGVPVSIKRSTFIIDEDGKLKEVLYGVNAREHIDIIKDKIAL